MSRIEKEKHDLNVQFQIRSDGKSKSPIELEDSIQLYWSVENTSDTPIWILGYYCPLWFESDFKGVYDKSKGDFIPNKFFISNERVRVFLRPNEMKSYVWDSVLPLYYGIDTSGTWTFKLEIEYRIQDESKITTPISASLEIIEDSKDFAKITSHLFGLLTIEKLRKFLPNEFQEIEPITDDENSLQFKAGRIGYIDYLGKDSEGPIIIEAKIIADKDSIYRIRKYIEWAHATLSYSLGEKIRGIIIGYEFKGIPIDFVKKAETDWNIKLLVSSGSDEPLRVYEGIEPENLVELAATYYTEGHLAKSEETYRQAIEYDRTNPTAWCGLGMTLQELDKLPEAKTAFQKAIEIDSKYSTAWFGIGAISYLTRNLNEAKEAISKALEIEPENLNYIASLGSILYEMGKLEEASEILFKGLDMDPNHLFLLQGLGLIFIDNKQFEQAEEVFRKALEIENENYDLWLSLAKIQVSLDELEDAEHSLKTALSLSKDSAEAWQLLGKLLYKQGKHQESQTALQKAAELSTGSSEILKGFSKN